MNKKIFFLILIFFLLSVSFALVNSVKAESLEEELSGKILLEVEQNGEAWYVYPVDHMKYYLGRPADAFQIMREFGLGVSNANFKSFNGYAPARLAGRILLQVETNGEAYYVNPIDLKMHYLGRPDDAFRIMRELGLGITDANLKKIIAGYNKFGVFDQIEINGKTYKAYKNKIVVIENGLEKIIWQPDQDYIRKAGEEVSFVSPTPHLRQSPSGYILFFEYLSGLSNCQTNGIQLDTYETLWNEPFSCGADISWSPDNKQVALMWDYFDELTLKVSTYGNIKSLTKIFDVLAPSNQDETKIYWESNDTLIFETSESDYDSVKTSFEKNGLILGINKFNVR